MTGRVVKILSFEYYVLVDGKRLKCSSRKKLKKDGDIFVGDMVEVVDNNGDYTVEKVYPRNNCLVRPYVANVELAVIVVAPQPAPDYVLADKLIASCLKNGIRPVLCYNKTDVEQGGGIDEFRREYAVFERVEVSANTGDNMDELEAVMSGKVCCLAGQSAVGKTSIMNALTGLEIETGDLSRKIQRGKNTTRHTEAYGISGGGLLIDTCGFSLLDLDVSADDLRLMYDEFEVGKCRFATCKHVNEPDCAVKLAVDEGKIPKGRYERYKIIYEELKRRKKQYE